MRNDIKKLKQDLSIKTNLLNHDLTFLIMSLFDIVYQNNTELCDLGFIL